jgi:hypothetical protein
MATADSMFTHIVLTADQLRVMRDAGGSVELRDESGIPVGLASPLSLPHGWTQEDIRLANAARNSGGPRYTTAQVLDALRSQER